MNFEILTTSSSRRAWTWLSSYELAMAVVVEECASNEMKTASRKTVEMRIQERDDFEKY